MDIMLFDNNASNAVAYFNMHTYHGLGQTQKTKQNKKTCSQLRFDAVSSAHINGT
jgi:hypothetical protein